MMMASSTTIPSTRMNANRLIMLMVTSVTGSTAKAPRKATAMPRITQPAILRCRNRPRMMSTSTAPSAMFLSIMSSRPSRKVEESIHTVSCASGGSVELRRST